MDKFTHEGNLSQPLQTSNKQLKIGVTFLTGFNGVVNFTTQDNKFVFISVFEEVDNNVITVSAEAYELKTFEKEST